MKLRQTLALLSRAFLVPNSSSEIAVEGSSVMLQRRVTFNGVGLKCLTTVASGGDKAAAQEEFATAKTSVWWDIENCGLPRGCNGHKIAKNLELALRERNYCGSLTIYAYGDTCQMSSPVQNALSSTGISLNHVPSGNKNGSDMKIIVDVLLWAMENQAPANIMLISGDGDFSYVLNKLRMKNHNILLVRPEKSYSPFLVSAAKTVLLWTSIVGSEDPKRDQPSKKSPMLCEICSVNCTNSVDFNTNISGKRHKKKVALVANPNQKDWFCSICQVSVSKTKAIGEVVKWCSSINFNPNYSEEHHEENL